MYGKVFNSLYKGSMRGKLELQAVFIYMLSNCDAIGVIDVVPQLIADAIGLDLPRVLDCIKELEGPDPESRTPDQDGARIERIDDHRSWGWRIINHAKYQRIRNMEDRREQIRTATAKWREAKRVNNGEPSVNIGEQSVNTCDHGEPIQIQIQTQIQTKTKTPASAMRHGVRRKSLENGEALPEGEITADQAFDEIFWPEYPRKRDKEAARKAWKALKLKDTDEDTIRTIIVALRRDLKVEWRDRDPDKVPYPATWLNRRGWLDG